MSTEYHVNITVGYKLSLPKILRKYEVRCKEVSHLEDRWDPGTGKKAPPIKIIDMEACINYVYSGTTYAGDDVEPLIYALSRKLKCDYEVEFHEVSEMCTPWEYSFVYFTVKIKTVGSEMIDYPLHLQASISLADLLEKESKIVALKTRLLEMGFKPPQPQIHLLGSVL